MSSTQLSDDKTCVVLEIAKLPSSKKNCNILGVGIFHSLFNLAIDR